MPTIACPGCGKQYKLPASAAGQVAKCACGKKFKVGGTPAAGSTSSTSTAASAPAKLANVAAKSAAVTKPATAVKSKVAAAAISQAAPAAPRIDDDFWEEGLEPVKPAAPLPPPPTAARPKPTAPTDAPKKRKKKSGGVKWGFDWGKVAGGLVAFLVAGGINYALFINGRINPWLLIVAVGGLFTALSGLMGEEGIW